VIFVNNMALLWLALRCPMFRNEFWMPTGFCFVTYMFEKDFILYF
jgi:hypothetical protein